MKRPLNLIMVLMFSITAFAETGNVGRVVGQLGLVEGNVLVDDRPVKKNAPVREGSVVEVKKGKATLILGKGSVFNLGADSKMVVNQYSANPAGENADLDLKFGKTRALILNQNDKKDIKIRARAATMGVRGTEIYMDVPKEVSKPLQVFTIEGKAELFTPGVIAPVAINQNQGVSTAGVAAPAAPTAQGGTASDAPKATAPRAAVTALSASEVKAEIKRAGLDAPAGGPAGVPPPPPPGPGRAIAGQLSDQLGIGALPPILLDPLLDRTAIISIQPRFCNATTGVCN